MSWRAWVFEDPQLQREEQYYRACGSNRGEGRRQGREQNLTLTEAVGEQPSKILYVKKGTHLEATA